MRLSHARWQTSARFDDPNLVSCAGLAAVSALAARAGLPRLLERSTVPAPNAATKLLAVIMGMVAGADSISDLDLLRHWWDAPAVSWGAGPLDAGDVPAGVHLRSCPPARRGRRPAAARAGAVRAAASRPRPARLPRHRRHRPGDPRLPQAGHRAGLHRGQRAQRAARDLVHPGAGAADRRGPAAPRRGELDARRPAPCSPRP